MPVDADTVRQMAKLARLDVPDERIESLSSEMGSILEYMGAISAWAGEAKHADRIPAFRRDDVTTPTHGDLTKASAHVDQNSVVVPPIKGAS